MESTVQFYISKQVWQFLLKKIFNRVTFQCPKTGQLINEMFCKYTPYSYSKLPFHVVNKIGLFLVEYLRFVENENYTKMKREWVNVDWGTHNFILVDSDEVAEAIVTSYIQDTIPVTQQNRMLVSKSMFIDFYRHLCSGDMDREKVFAEMRTLFPKVRKEHSFKNAPLVMLETVGDVMEEMFGYIPMGKDIPRVDTLKFCYKYNGEIAANQKA